MTNRATWPRFSPEDDPLDILVGLSRFYGRDPGMVLAGGGNTSVKLGDRLHVKASGHALADIDRGGFVTMDRGLLDELARADLGADPDTREARFKEAIYAARVEPEKGQRPSVECLLHHLIGDRFVVHSHSTIVNTLTCCVEGERLAGELFGETVLWLPYVDPGFTLARELKTRLEAYLARTGGVGPRAILMANHGLVVAADHPGEIRHRTGELIESIRRRLGPDWKTRSFGEPIGEGRAVSRLEAIRSALVRVQSTDEAHREAVCAGGAVVLGVVGTDEGWRGAQAGPMTPDQIVYCTSYPLGFEVLDGEDDEALASRLRDAMDEHTHRTRFAPRIVLVRGLGLLALGKDAAACATTRDVYIDAATVMAGAQRLGGIRYLTDAQRVFIEDWEVEAFRREVAQKARTPEKAD